MHTWIVISFVEGSSNTSTTDFKAVSFGFDENTSLLPPALTTVSFATCYIFIIAECMNEMERPEEYHKVIHITNACMFTILLFSSTCVLIRFGVAVPSFLLSSVSGPIGFVYILQFVLCLVVDTAIAITILAQWAENSIFPLCRCGPHVENIAADRGLKTTLRWFSAVFFWTSLGFAVVAVLFPRFNCHVGTPLWHAPPLLELGATLTQNSTKSSPLSAKRLSGKSFGLRI